MTERNFSRREFVLLSVALSSAPRLFAASQREVRVNVFGLFHPRELIVRDVSGRGLALAMASGPLVLRSGSARLAVAGAGMVIDADGRSGRGLSLSGAGLSGESTEFELAVPGRIERRFRGRLEIAPRGDVLTATVVMDLEIAVASVVAAELPGLVEMEAAKAQAVAARAYFVATRGRHAGGAFCDTTHCQFLREAPDAGEAAMRAARDTAALVLAYRESPIEALYSASCGGHTRTRSDAGFGRGHGYPFFSVECAGCLEQRDAAMRGHGVGLCQDGARAMAASGAGFEEILAHYYPGTTLTAV